jgi:phenylacetate-coenzyme A ligase PaaK-like adenylate-forming protein
VFGCPVINEYGASECLSIGFACSAGRLHLNAEWVILEPVDEAGRPTPPGEPSATVLVTNLANRLQPIIRYDLGDSVTMMNGACPCGNPLQSFLVGGRREDVIALPRPDGGVAKLLPLALSTIVEEAGGVHRFQIVQTGDDVITLRLPHDIGAHCRERAWPAIRRALLNHLARESLPGVRVELDPAPPQARTRGGKAHEVIAQHRHA